MAHRYLYEWLDNLYLEYFDRIDIRHVKQPHNDRFHID